MSAFDRQMEKDDVKELQKQFPLLDFQHALREETLQNASQGEYVHEYGIAEVRGFKNSPNTVLRFREAHAFTFLANDLKGLPEISILHPKAALLTDNLFFAILDYYEPRSGRMFPLGPFDFYLRSRLTAETFILEHDEFELKVRMGGLDERLDKAWKFIGQDTTESDFISCVINESNSYFLGMNEQELSRAWDYLILSLCLGFSDNRYVNLDLMGDSFIFFLPRLTKMANNFITIETTAQGNNSFRAMMVQDWERITNSAFFSYYSVYEILPQIVNLHSEESKEYRYERPEHLTRNPRLCRETSRHFYPELLQYIKVAENSATPTFRFLSFYHVLESFFDEAQYQAITKDVNEILRSPDIARTPEKHTAKIVEMLVTHRVGYETDQHNLQKLLEFYLHASPIPDILPKEIQTIMKKRVKFEGGLILEGISLRNSSRFFNDISRRIYLLRNAIVHSKRIVDEKKGRVTHTYEEYRKIERESKMLRYFVIEILSRAGLKGSSWI